MPSAPVVQKANSAIYWVYHYLMQKGVGILILSDFSGGWRCPNLLKNRGLFLISTVKPTGPFNTSCSITLSPVQGLIGTQVSHGVTGLLNCRIFF